MSARIRDYGAFGLRLLLGGVLVYAGFAKLNDAAQFAETIANYRMLSPVGNQVLAVILPWCELVAGFMLIFGVWTRPAAMVATLLFSAFGVAVIAALMRGLDIHCGCFGTGSSRLGVATVLIDAAGLASAILLVCLCPIQTDQV